MKMMDLLLLSVTKNEVQFKGTNRKEFFSLDLESYLNNSPTRNHSQDRCQSLKDVDGRGGFLLIERLLPCIPWVGLSCWVCEKVLCLSTWIELLDGGKHTEDVGNVFDPTKFQGFLLCVCRPRMCVPGSLQRCWWWWRWWWCWLLTKSNNKKFTGISFSVFFLHNTPVFDFSFIISLNCTGCRRFLHKYSVLFTHRFLLSSEINLLAHGHCLRMYFNGLWKFHALL